MSTSCAVKPAISASPRRVSVNGVEIAREAIARETQNHPAEKPIEAWRAAARALAIREMLLQEARRIHLVAVPLADEAGRRETMDEALIRALVESEVFAPEPSTEECRRYYANNRAKFRTPDLHAAAHILLPAADAAQREAAREKARGILSILAGDPGAFAALAALHSACPSRGTGGELGQIGPGQTVPEFEAALGRMAPGAVHPEPVETRYGVHIVRLDRRMEGRDLPFELVADRIAGYLAECARRSAERHFVMRLAAGARIEGIELETAASPLVQ